MSEGSGRAEMERRLVQRSIEDDLALGLREALLNRPALLADSDESLHGRLWRAVSLVEAHVFGVDGAPADQEPAPHAPLGV